MSFEDPDRIGIRVQKRINTGEVTHYIKILTIKSFFEEHLGVDPYNEISFSTWITLPEKKLPSLAKGKMFHDGVNLNKVLGIFKYYPRDVWLYLLASQWLRISQEEAFIGRA
jgi:hypothetical protein